MNSVLGVPLPITATSLSLEGAAAITGLNFLKQAFTPRSAQTGGSQTHTSSSGSTHGGHGGTFGEKKST